MGSGCSQQAKAGVVENAQEGAKVDQNPVSAANPAGAAATAATAKVGTPKAVKIEIASDGPSSMRKSPKANKSDASVDANKMPSATSPSNTRRRRRANDTTNVLSKEEIQAKFDIFFGHCSTHMDSDHKLDERIPQKLLADKWDDRLDALTQIQSKLSKIKLSALDDNALAQSFVNLGAIIVHAMNDTVRPVSITSLEVFRKFLEVFGKRFGKNPAVCAATTETGASIAELLTTSVGCLLYRMGDSNIKVRSEAESTMLDIVQLSFPRGMPIVWGVLFVTGQEGAVDAAILQRLVMMKALIGENGFSKKDGFTIGATMSVAVPSLAIADQKTRTAAMDLVVAAYAVAGERVNKHLHGCKPAMIKILQRKFQEHHDTELFGGDDVNDQKSKRKEKRNKRKEMAKKRSNQHSPGAGNSDEDDDSDSEGEAASDKNKSGASLAIPEPMSEVEEATALANAVNLLQDLPGLGVVLVHKMQSDKWSDRKDGLDQVSEWTTTREMEARVQGAAAAGAGAAQGQQQEEQQQQQTATVSVEKRLELSNEFAAHCALLQPAIEQNVLPVVLSACTCLRKLIKLYGSVADWSGGEAYKRAHFMVPALLDKANGTNQRVQREACKCLLDLCHASNGAGLQVVVPHLKDTSTRCIAVSGGHPMSRKGTPEAASSSSSSCRPVTAGGSASKSAPKSTVRAKLVLIKVLLRELGIKSTRGANAGQVGCGLTTREVMKITKPALNDADAKIRKSGIAVVIELEKIVGITKTMKYLDGVKPALLSKIEMKINPEAAAKSKEARLKSRSALPPLSDLKPRSQSKKKTSGSGHLKPLGSTSKGQSFGVIGHKAPLVKPAHVNPNNVNNNVVPGSPSVARSLDFASELMDQDEEDIMNSILGGGMGNDLAVF